MDYRTLEDEFYSMRKKQMGLHQRELTPIAHEVSQLVFETANRAIENVARNNKLPCMQAVPLSTGLGKSTAAYALIATFALHDPSFTAAYVVPTARMAEEAQQGIEALLGANSTTLWTTYHNIVGVNQEKAEAALGHVPVRLVDTANLPYAKILIVTHGKLKAEVKSGRDSGVIKYKGVPRKIVFLDEHADLVNQMSTTPAELQTFHDQLVRHDSGHHWLPILSGVVQRMSAITHLDGQTYVPAELLNADQARVFDNDEGLVSDNYLGR
jgi:hypothetical protein